MTCPLASDVWLLSDRIVSDNWCRVNGVFPAVSHLQDKYREPVQGYEFLAIMSKGILPSLEIALCPQLV
jgi:hypothetical protein